MVLMKLNLRQESNRHAEALDAITNYLDMGTYSEWDEVKKLEFFTRELKGKRPLVPPTIQSANVPTATNSRLSPLSPEHADFYNSTMPIDIPLDIAADLKKKEKELQAKEAELRRREQLVLFLRIKNGHLSF